MCRRQAEPNRVGLRSPISPGGLDCNVFILEQGVDNETNRDTADGDTADEERADEERADEDGANDGVNEDGAKDTDGERE